MKLVLIASLLCYVTAEWLQQRAPTQFELKNIYQDFALQLVQQNLDKLHEISASVENPTSKDFGKFLTVSEIADIVGQPTDAISKIENWLKGSCEDVCKLKIKVGAHRDYVTVHTCLARIQCMFNVEMVQYQNTETNKILFRSNSGGIAFESLPVFLRSYIENTDMIHNFPDAIRRIRHADSQNLSEKSGSVDIYPAIINENYGMDQYPSINYTGPQSSQAVVEFMDCYWKSSDILEFQQLYDLPINNVTNIIGDYAEPAKSCDEAVLDLEYITAVSNLETWAFAFSDLNWMKYFQTIAATEGAPLVHSMSWGSMGNDGMKIKDQQLKRLNIELEKLTTAGFTFVGASGDAGTNGNGLNGSKKVKSTFPTDSPYVTAVGATRLLSYDSGATQCATFWSGSAFSEIFPRPDWQDSAVETYLSSGVSLPSPNLYNASGRAFADVSAYGDNFKIIQNGRNETVRGTSASAPVFAAMVAYANAMREQSGKGPLGNINPRLYAAGNIGTDITCGASVHALDEPTVVPILGPKFTSTTGWDPASGLGAPTASALFDILMQ